MPIPQKDIDLITERADIVDVIGHYVRLQQRGGRFWGLSPFKSEKTPSFCVDREKGMYYCFSTHQGGNIFTFLMQIEHLNFPEAVEAVAKQYGITYHSGKNENDETRTERNALIELYARVTASFHYLLTHGNEAEAAKHYLQSRGLTMDTITSFNIGYCPQQSGWLWQFLTKKSYSPQLLQKSGLFHAHHPRQALFAGRIVFPITNRKDEVIAFGGRSHIDAPPKYINSPDTLLFKKRNELFGKLRAITRAANADSSEIYIVEGYTDVLALHQMGVPNVVATLGTAFSAEQARTLTRLGGSAILLFDTDEAGRRATLRAAHILREAGLSPRVCRLADGRDPADMLRVDSEFKKNCQKMLAQNTKSMIEYLLEIEFPKKQFANTAQSDSALKRIFEYIALVTTEIKRDSHLRQVADYLARDRDTVLKGFHEWTRNRSTDAPHSARAQVTPRAAHSSEANRFEIECMVASISCPQEFQYLRAIVDTDCFENRAARYLYELQERAFQNNTTDSKEVIEMIVHPKLKDYVIRKMVVIDTTDCQKTVSDIAHRLKKRHLIRNRGQHIALLRTLEQDANLDSEQVQEIQLEIMYLNREILKQ